MKKKPASRSAFFNPRVLISFAFGAIGLLLAPLVFAAPPPNDMCSGAIVLNGAGPFPLLSPTTDVTDATSTGEPVTTCVGTNDDRIVWYSFTPTATGTYRISTCATVATSCTVNDTVLGIFTSDCTVFTEITCDDDSCTTEADQSTVTTVLTAGTTYLIYTSVFGFGNPAPPPPDNIIQVAIELLPPPEIVTNGSFESPDIPNNNFDLSSSQGGWTFAGNAGINDPFSGYTSPEAPDGQQFALLQTSGTAFLSNFSRTITLPSTGTFTLSFLDAGRDGGTGLGDVIYDVFLDGAIIFTDATYTAQLFELETVTFTGTAGDHILKFQVSAANTGIGTAFFDAIAIAIAAAECIPPPPNMIAWWPGDGNADDIQGGHNGTLLGGATFAAGKVAQAFSFNGASARVDVGDVDLPATFAIDAWINPANTSNYQSIISKDHSTLARGYEFAVTAGGALRAFVFNDATEITFYETAAVITAGIFQHVAVTYDGNAGAGEKFKFYVNGVSVAASPIGPEPGGAPLNTAVTAKIGIAGDGANYPFNGLIDELELFSRVLSELEIKSIADAGSFGKCKCTPPPADMVSWWPAEGDADDIQDGNDGTLVNGATFAAGKVGQAFSLNGSDQYVSLGNPANLQITGAITLDAWVNPDDFGEGELREIISKWGQNFTSCGPGTNGDAFLFALTKTGGVIRPRIYIHRSDLDEPALEGGNTPAGVFSHVATTYDAATGFFALYVNGVEVASATLSPLSLCTSDTDVLIGAEAAGPQRFFPGRIDEVEIFNRALSAAEIQAIYNAGSAGKCKPCTTYSADFVQGQAPSAQASQDWVNFRASLNPSAYSTVTISGTFDTTGRTLTDAGIVPQIAQALRDGTTGSWEVGGVTWNVGPCVGGIELNANDSGPGATDVCECPNPGYVVRPEIVNPNWGGVNTATCAPPSQTITVTFCGPPPPVPVERQFLNISSRASVGTGENVAIAGLIVHSDSAVVALQNGPVPRGTPSTKNVLIRGLGPSLNITGDLDDPFLELHAGNGSLITSNDDWQSDQETEIEATGLAPTDVKEAAILATLDVGSAYTAILSGVGGTSGIGLIEVYDLDALGDSHLANISTRAFVSTGPDVLIGGIIVQGGTPTRVVLRGIGPSLTAQGVANALLDPFLELHDGNGALLETNDDWLGSPEAAQITASGLAPTDPKESAILFTPAPGNYTAIVSGVGATTGIGLVEAYNIGP